MGTRVSARKVRNESGWTRPIAGLGEKCPFWQEVCPFGFCPEPSLGGVPPDTPSTPHSQPAQSLTWEPPSSTSLLTSPFCPQGGLSQDPISAATVDHVPSLPPHPPPICMEHSTWETTFLEIDPGEGALRGSNLRNRPPHPHPGTSSWRQGPPSPGPSASTGQRSPTPRVSGASFCSSCGGWGGPHPRLHRLLPGSLLPCPPSPLLVFPAPSAALSPSWDLANPFCPALYCPCGSRVRFQSADICN